MIIDDLKGIVLILLVVVGCFWLVLGGVVFFLVDDVTHPDSSDMHAEADRAMACMALGLLFLIAYGVLRN